MDIESLMSSIPVIELSKMTPVRIKKIRKYFSMTQVEFAEILGISYHTYKNWEIGHRFPSSPAVGLLCIAENFPDIFIKQRELLKEQIKKYFI